MDSSSFSEGSGKACLYIVQLLTKCDLGVNGCANNGDIVNVVTSQTENDDVVDVNSINCWTAARSGLGHLIRLTRKDKC